MIKCPASLAESSVWAGAEGFARRVFNAFIFFMYTPNYKFQLFYRLLNFINFSLKPFVSLQIPHIF